MKKCRILLKMAYARHNLFCYILLFLLYIYFYNYNNTFLDFINLN